MSEEKLLEWMTNHPQNLSLHKENQGWVIGDIFSNQVLASGETAFEALSRAHLLNKCGVYHDDKTLDK